MIANMGMMRLGMSLKIESISVYKDEGEDEDEEKEGCNAMRRDAMTRYAVPAINSSYQPSANPEIQRPLSNRLLRAENHHGYAMLCYAMTSHKANHEDHESVKTSCMT